MGHGPCVIRALLDTARDADIVSLGTSLAENAEEGFWKRSATAVYRLVRAIARASSPVVSSCSFV